MRLREPWLAWDCVGNFGPSRGLGRPGLGQKSPALKWKWSSHKKSTCKHLWQIFHNKKWKQSKISSTHEWKNKLYYILIMEYYSATRRKERLIQTTQTNLRCIMSSEEIILKQTNKQNTVWKSSEMGSETLNTLWRHQASTFKGTSCRTYSQQEKSMCQISQRFSYNKGISHLYPGQFTAVSGDQISSQQLHKTILSYCYLNPCWSRWQAQN